MFEPTKSKVKNRLKIVLGSNNEKASRSGEYPAITKLSGGYALHSRLPHILWLADPPTAHVLYHL